MTRYPLTWPTGWKRTKAHDRRLAKFNHQGRELTILDGCNRVIDSLSKMFVDEDEIIFSTNVEPRLNGIPRSGRREPDDPGVAVYWQTPKDKIPKVIAVDQYDRVADNLGAVAATLEAMRAIDRHGGALILERAFMGFTCLPSPNDWRHVLGFEETPTLVNAEARYRDLAKKQHPDHEGHHQRMCELNNAIEDARRELTQ